MLTIRYRFLLVKLDNRTYALPLEAVERVLRVVEILPVPDTSPVLAGVINIHGDIIPVVALRRWLKLPEKDVTLLDRLVLTQIHETRVVLLVDEVLDIVEPPLIDVMRAQSVHIKSGVLQGVLELDGEAVYMCDLEKVPQFELPEEVMDVETAETIELPTEE